ncbi:hypothetical protein CHS0354_027891 [Potamilus streckersoni]|uniref:G kinase-anchoring protein 1 n=1 Tax=Potamilus streckersoni TaxID=2493646 RepID=A0AAE0W7B7_9BIVA|nr:hypothetical protein CHS0354_027891 [Potamilus streckersoni]
MAKISVKPSRFALLKIEDDDDDDVQKEGKPNEKLAQKSKSSQKKAKKKKTAESGPQSNPQGIGGGDWAVQTGGKAKAKSNKNVTEEQWEQWQKVDKELTTENFEKDLQQAILLSKLEYEENKQQPKHLQQQHQGRGDPDKATGESKEGKKKKKKDKPNAMSLEEFNKLSESKQQSTTDNLDDDFFPPSQPAVRIPPPQPAAPNSQEGDQFFESIDSDVNRIMRQEKMQEEYKKQYAVENVISAKYKEEILKKDKEIEFLKATLKKQEEELQQVKKRNKQLCVILAQGEMKDKAEVLMQVEQLTQIKDELTDQVQELTAELEKERSKNHGLKADFDKLKDFLKARKPVEKGSKHGGK